MAARHIRWGWRVNAVSVGTMVGWGRVERPHVRMCAFSGNISGNIMGSAYIICADIPSRHIGNVFEDCVLRRRNSMRRQTVLS